MESVANEESVDDDILANELDDKLVKAFHKTEEIFLADGDEGLLWEAVSIDDVFKKALRWPLDDDCDSILESIKEDG